MNLKAYRESKNLTQAQLAAELKGVAEGLDVPLISKIEKGLCEPPQAVVSYIAGQYSQGLKVITGKKAPTQRDMVLDYINRFGYITSWDAYKDLGITQLATRIFELEEIGYSFDKKTITGKNRFGANVKWTEYRLKEDA